MITHVYVSLPLFITRPCLLKLTVYTCFPMFTLVNQRLPLFTRVYLCFSLPMITCVYLCLHICGIAGENRPSGAKTQI